MLETSTTELGVTVSLVSHGHGQMVENLVRQIEALPSVSKIIVTMNIPEKLDLQENNDLQIMPNTTPRGFGANHNAAFQLCRTSHFCVINPDITLESDVFRYLLECMDSSNASVSAPLVRSSSGKIEDSIRYFPTIGSLILKMLGMSDGRYKVQPDNPMFYPEWIAGMFMLFKSDDFARLRGFDEKFFLYYEDVDICARIWKAGMRVVACPSVSVIHDARRASRRNLQHMQWHAASILRFFWKHAGRLPAVCKEIFPQ